MTTAIVNCAKWLQPAHAGAAGAGAKPCVRHRAAAAHKHSVTGTPHARPPAVSCRCATPHPAAACHSQPHTGTGTGGCTHHSRGGRPGCTCVCRRAQQQPGRGSADDGGVVVRRRSRQQQPQPGSTTHHLNSPTSNWLLLSSRLPSSENCWIFHVNLPNCWLGACLLSGSSRNEEPSVMVSSTDLLRHSASGGSGVWVSTPSGGRCAAAPFEWLPPPSASFTSRWEDAMLSVTTTPCDAHHTHTSARCGWAPQVRTPCRRPS